MNTELFTRNGVTQYVRPGDPDDKISMDEVLTYEFPNEFEVRTVLDIGAHIGSYVVAIKARYPDAECVAIEPDADNFEVLMQNCQRLSSVTALLARVGYADQAVYLMRHEAHSTCHAIVRAEDVRADGQYSVAPDAVSLSEVMMLRGWDEVSVLKIDCESCEVPFFNETSDEVLRRVRLFTGEHHSTPSIFLSTIGTHLKRIGYEVSVEMEEGRHSTFAARRLD